MDIASLLTPELPSEIPDSQESLDSLLGSSTQSWDSQNGPRPELPSKTPDSRQSLDSLLGSLTQSWDSQNGPRPEPNREPSTELESLYNFPQTPRREYTPMTTRSDRIRIRTALNFNIPIKQIQAKYGFTERQIRLAKRTLSPRKKGHCDCKPAITTPKR
jgi:hypothetical protein